MTESHEPYIAGRKKVFSVSGAIQTTPDMTLDEFIDEFIDWIESKGWAYGGGFGVTYEEEE
jgi:uncharacterized protein YggL (DUF469 family)